MHQLEKGYFALFITYTVMWPSHMFVHLKFHIYLINQVEIHKLSQKTKVTLDIPIGVTLWFFIALGFSLARLV